MSEQKQEQTSQQKEELDKYVDSIMNNVKKDEQKQRDLLEQALYLTIQDLVGLLLTKNYTLLQSAKEVNKNV